jgi:hypothetical protein
VLGGVNADGTLIPNAAGFVVTKNDNAYVLAFPGKTFSRLPFVTVTPVGGTPTITEINASGSRTGGWAVTVRFSAATAFTFVAASLGAP